MVAPACATARGPNAFTVHASLHVSSAARAAPAMVVPATAADVDTVYVTPSACHPAAAANHGCAAGAKAVVALASTVPSSLRVTRLLLPNAVALLTCAAYWAPEPASTQAVHAAVAWVRQLMSLR